MHRQISLLKGVVVLFLLGTTLVAVAQRSAPSTVRVPICVKGNGQLRMLIDDNATCGPSEELMEWMVGGAVTDITPGRGLIGSREDGEVQLELDPSVIQGCGSCAGGKVFAGFNDGPGDIPTGTGVEQHGDPLPVIGSLPLQPDAYVVVAKLWVKNTSNLALLVSCRLSAGADFDWVTVTVEANDRAAMALTVVHEFSEADFQPVAVVGCKDAALEAGTEWNDLKIIATQVSDIANVFLGGS